MIQPVRREAMVEITDHRGPAWVLHAADYAGWDVSLVINEIPPGNGAPLHTHTYDEVFVVVAGDSTFSVGTGDDATRIALQTGDVLRVPAGIPHGFTNSGTQVLRQVDIHLTALIGGVRLAGPTGDAEPWTFPRRS